MSSSGPWRLGPTATRAFDLALATALVLGSVSGALVGSALAMALSAAETAPLFWRRTRPAVTFAAVAGVSALQAVVYSYPVWGQVAFPIALYSVARFGRPREGWVALGVGLAATVTASIVWVGQFNTEVPADYRDDLTASSYVPYLLTLGAIVVAAWALGTQARIRRAYEATLLERGEQMAAEAEQRTRAAAAEERTRVAREMHDVVAHGITGMIVQADGARYAAEHDPAVAVRTLDTIAGTGREALDEMRRLLGLLRGTDDPARVPQPGLADLPSLLAPDVEAGRARTDLPDPMPDVAPGVALTVFRLTQEAMTNVRKHAGPGARATISVRSTSDAVMVEVLDDGRGAGGGPGDGLGLVGMRERVTVHGGEVSAGPAAGGGWRVSARIPR